MNMKDKMLDYIKLHHKGQVRLSSQLPYWRHCANVSEILDFAIRKHNEFDNEVHKNLLLAALGHDLYEDTSATKEEVIDMFGQQVHSYILLLTNGEEGSGDVQSYINNLLHSSEEAVLVKLCDAIDNTVDTAYSLHELDSEWTSKKFIPHVKKMHRLMQDFVPKKYPKTHHYLSNLFDFSIDRLLNNYNKMNH